VSYYYSNMIEDLRAGGNPLVLSLRKWEIGVKEIEEAVAASPFVSFDWLLSGSNCALCYQYSQNGCKECPLSIAGFQCCADGSKYNLAGDVLESYELDLEQQDGLDYDHTPILRAALSRVKDMRDVLSHLVEENKKES
jgi:hypothetical protein